MLIHCALTTWTVPFPSTQLSCIRFLQGKHETIPPPLQVQVPQPSFSGRIQLSPTWTKKTPGNQFAILGFKKRKRPPCSGTRPPVPFWQHLPSAFCLVLKPCLLFYDDVIKWKHFPRYWPFVRGIHRWIPLTKASDTELWCFLRFAWINGWVNNRGAGDLSRHRAHYDVIVMSLEIKQCVDARHARIIHGFKINQVI